jgi:hypothetical protein
MKGRKLAAIKASEVTRVHRKTIRISNADLVSSLKQNLGTQVVALIAGVDKKTVLRWIEDRADVMRDESEKRLRAAYQVFELLATVDAPPTIRAWFIGMNPQLEDDSPAEALAEGKLREVLSAARAFVDGA